MQGSSPLPLPNSAQDAEAAERPFELNQLLALLWVGWPTLLAAVLVATLAGLFYCFVTPPSYQTDALVQVESDQNSARVALTQVADQISPDLSVPTEIEILKSRLVLGQVVEHMKLDIAATPVFFPVIGNAFWRGFHNPDAFAKPPFWLRPFTRSYQSWGGEVLQIASLDIPPELENTSLLLKSTGNGNYELFTAAGDRVLGGHEGVLASGQWRESTVRMMVSRLKALPGKDFFVRKYPPQLAISSLQQQLAAVAKSNVNLITLSLSAPDASQAQEILNEILNVYQSQNLARKAEGAEQTLGFLKKQLPALRTQVDEAEDKLNRFKVRQGTADLAAETSIILQRNVELEEKIGTLQQKRSEIRLVFTEDNPEVVAIDKQLATYRGDLARINGRIKELPDAQQEILSLMRDVNVSNSLYISLLNRTQELEVVKSGTLGNIRIIDRPFRPLYRKSPDKTKIMLISMAIGVFAGIAIILLTAMLRNGVDDPDVLEKSLGVATYGSVPYSEIEQKLSDALRKSGAPGGILAAIDPSGASMEALRSVRTALYFAQIDAANNVLMITGPEPGVGKSFISINLAASLASAGKKVVVVDADLRLGHVHEQFGVPRAGGLSEVIAGQLPLEKAIRSTGFDNLSLISSGTIPPNPAELLINPQFVAVLNALSAQFDHVILDTPPALAVADPAIIGRHAGITLLVLKAGKHPLRMIEETLKRLHTSGVVVRGTLFNQVGLGRHGKYGYYSGYHYQGYNYNAKPGDSKV